MIGNKITLPTWRWLNVNGTNIDLPDFGNVEYKLAKSTIAPQEHIECEINKYPHGFSDDDNNDLAEHKNLTNYIYVEKNENKKLTLFNYPQDKENPLLIDSQTIVAQEGSKVEILYHYYNQDNDKTFRHSELRIIARDNSFVKVYIVQNNGENAMTVQAISSILYENARVELVDIEAGSSKAYLNCRASLIGDNSSIDTSTIYFGYKNDYLNLFYNFDQIGKATNSNVIVKGGLKNKSSKVFKASLDFKKGSTKSVGNEAEYVTLLSEEVNSIAVPLLLCHEDDVIGNHASSAGRIDKDMMFYIMSRGISKKEAEKMIIESNLRPTIDLIPDNEIAEIVWDRIEGKIIYE